MANKVYEVAERIAAAVKAVTGVAPAVSGGNSLGGVSCYIGREGAQVRVSDHSTGARRFADYIDGLIIGQADQDAAEERCVQVLVAAQFSDAFSAAVVTPIVSARRRAAYDARQRQHELSTLQSQIAAREARLAAGLSEGASKKVAAKYAAAATELVALKERLQALTA